MISISREEVNARAGSRAEKNPVSLQDAERPSLDSIEISSHLEILNFPKKALFRYSNCGKPSNVWLMATCGCGTMPFEANYRCNLTFCTNCSHLRKRRFYRRLEPFLKHFRQDSMYDYRFLTISPQNYEDLEKGKKHIRKSFQKFIRRKYIKERIKGGFYVLEITNHGKGWNIHLHAIVYSRHLDNVFRGECSSCFQSYLKWDRISKKFYCANRKCNMVFQSTPKFSRMQTEFTASSGLDCHVDISRVKSASSVLNYALKYISSSKDSFDSIQDFAFAASKSYHDRLINAFGEFYNFKFLSSQNSLNKPFFCPRCFEVLKFSFDIEVSRILSRKPDPPPIQRFLIAE